MTTMRALIGREGKVEIVEVAVPEAGAGQVRVKVAAAAVQPVDLFSASGTLPDFKVADPQEAYGLGWDVAGVIDQVGPGVTGFAAGQPVFGLADRLMLPHKVHAEYVILDAGEVAAAPEGISPVEAATLPLNTLTAIQALDLAGLAAGQSLLVTGAAGALGGYLVEIAAARGLRVVGLAGAGDEGAVRGFGAEWFVPRGADLAAAVRAAVPGGVDGVVDAAIVGLAALDSVRGGGAFVAVAAGAAPVPLRGIRVTTVYVRSDAGQLAQVARWAAAGRLALRVAGTYPLEQAADAYARLGAGGLRGRLVLTP
ncbi:NADP-dependent oxidoreductase [Nonomuraea typhae]|uniref:NADP-dependent oxidoreductase n=1 Tax=Nonomuraea typhae TaxID=2603600 RepID=UPI001FEA2C2C|nr:NADP-dependent oxidoreductase [Nonomuraea typhae]